MLVRFNKGPWHRKVSEISPDDAKRGVLRVAVYDSKFNRVRLFEPRPDVRTMVYPGTKVATYRLKMVKVNVRGQDEWLPSIFPDGAVCFELEGIH